MWPDSGELGLQPGEVQVWLLDAEALERLAEGSDMVLDGEELAQAPRFADPALALAWRGRRTALRRLLSAYTGQPPRALRLVRERGQKPRLAEGQAGPRFSVSASGGWMAAAFGQAELGLDIEQVREDIEWEALAAQFFSPEELAWLQARPTELRQREAFFQVWTRKEAQLKLKGVGLAGLEALRDPQALGRSWVEDLELELPAGVCGSLALERAPARLKVRVWPGQVTMAAQA